MKYLFSLLFLLSLPISAFNVIYTSEYIDVLNEKVILDSSITIDKGLIVSIDSGYIEVDKTNSLIDLRGYTLMPGLMDMHVHFGQEYLSKSERPGKVERETAAIMATQHAYKTLKAGFTTVRQVGDSGMVAISLRDAINAGHVIGPRIFTSGKSIATTGGHADPTNGLASGDYIYPTAEDGVINGPYDAYAAVRQRYKDGADGIKLTVTGGVLSVAKSGDNPQFTAEEVASVVNAAKDYGMWVAVHAHGAEGMKRAVIAGVNSVEHGTFMTEEVMDLMIKNGTYYVPTISAGEFVAEKAKIDNYFPDIVRPKAASVGPQIAATFEKAYKRGVKIAFGTDAGVQAHGTNWREFVYMSENGMPPIETIKAATIETAKLLSIDLTHGSITVGKVADLVAVKGNPLDDMYLMQDISFVMKGGESVFFNR
ncbi:amidohydrolase family protein [Gammaproteobacteria bacterium]|jgi:imidazolonepropionase-like amidohydrolase|nr:amidohydrolase family protein [Gammaproteobacteria bacterium]MDA9266008.1 amidohydrolase family protein [Gammaproteobacteria bacterium]MDA9356134.1 amidohydrolase family protein [Gammaproteobacteria bacterium]MDC1189625.1 amidohydrolase family protein [Gammaproteobacteria bacterium]